MLADKKRAAKRAEGGESYFGRLSRTPAGKKRVVQLLLALKASSRHGRHVPARCCGVDMERTTARLVEMDRRIWSKLLEWSKRFAGARQSKF